MPLKSPNRRTHHVAHHKEKRSKRFLKVYAPYIPLLIIIGCGIFVSSRTEVRTFNDSTVKSYATNTTDAGLLEATNKMRNAQGLKSLVMNQKLDSAAQNKAVDMSSKNYWSHATPEGRQPWAFIDEAGYSYKKAAENLAYGFDTSNSTVNGWMESPGHRANILDADLEEVGFGIIDNPDYQGHGPETLVVAMYGRPASGIPVALPSETENMPVVAAISKPKEVSYIASVTGNNSHVITLSIGIAVGLIIMYLVLKHARGLRRAARGSESFIVKHPLLDITLVAFLALAAIVSQTVGTIH